jgi:hypothetical protein
MGKGVFSIILDVVDDKDKSLSRIIYSGSSSTSSYLNYLLNSESAPV